MPLSSEERRKRANARQARWRAANPEKAKAKGRRGLRTMRECPERRARLRERSNARRALVRRLVLEHYSGGTLRCSCCGEGRYEFLAIDHIDGGGTQHKKRERITNLAYWLFNHNLPPGYRVLCHNCNCARGFYGFCPHERERSGG